MALLLAPMIRARGESRPPALAFVVYLLPAVAAAFCGSYPVPVMHRVPVAIVA